MVMGATTWVAIGTSDQWSQPPPIGEVQLMIIVYNGRGEWKGQWKGV